VAAPAYQLVVFSGEDIRTFDLPVTGDVTIGRGEGSTVRIEDPSVSRRHAVIHVSDASRAGDALEIEDLGGANGTFVRQAARAAQGNDTLHVNVRQLLGRSAPLAIGDCLLFGTVCVALRRRPGVDAAPGAVIDDPAMRALHAEAARVARSNISVLLLGETGAGKEVLARAIHAGSPRAGGPFLGVNCAALAESLLESELFGSEKGAFTGAVTRAGLFEAAAGGSVFLDEVGELPPTTQAKLLRVLEDRTVTRLGSTKPRAADVRFIAATNRDLEADSRNGRVRSDLYFRLAGVTLTVPPLRDRSGDIEALAATFIRGACRDLDREPPVAISPAALERLHRYSWPGNVRELRNAMERAVVMCAETTILPEHLPPALLAARAPAPSAAGRAAPSLQAEMKSLERERILAALERCDGNQSEAARQLGMPRRTLVARLGELGLTRRRRPDGETGRE
jgi:two-component system, NtrC family, response regulator AtoC